MTPQTRIDRRFAALQGRGPGRRSSPSSRPAIRTSRRRKEILLGLPEAGADVIELGMPFSDPMADGPAIQASSQRALKAGQTMRKTLDHGRANSASATTDTPIVLMGYYNPIYVYPRRALPRRRRGGRRRRPDRRRRAARGRRRAVPAGR